MKPIIFSSFAPLPDFWFQGYCFRGADTILGSEGARSYRKSGGSIEPGEDGCYIVLNRAGRGYRIGADFKGYAHLFIYSKGSTWAVSNSITALADYLRTKGVTLSPNPPQIASWHMRRAFGNQMTSHRTAFVEISLLPSWCCVDVDEAGAHLVARKTQDLGDYRAELAGFLSIWVSRIAALLKSNCSTIYCDVTGGRDSRAVLSLILSAERLTGYRASEKLIFLTDMRPQFADDNKVAHQLGEQYNFSLHGRRKQVRTLSTVDAYRQWKSLDVGSYGPIYFPDKVLEGHTVEFGGGGGESHRPFYDMIDVDAFLLREGVLIPARYQAQWASDVKQSIEIAMASAPRPMHPLIHHYREFRDRFHAGRSQMRVFHWAPLGSKYLQRASDAADESALREHQVLYDIMHCLIPGIEAMPYDTPAKMPTSGNLARFPALPKLNFVSGTIHGDLDSHLSEDQAYDRSDLLRLLLDDVDQAIDAIEVADFPPGYIKKIRDQLASDAEVGRLEHAVRGLGAHHLLIAHASLKNATKMPWWKNFLRTKR